jgi:hypothetical protein
MAMQVKTWMTKFLFSTWISHFLESVSRMDSISPTSRHLLTLDGYTSHVTLEVVKVTRGAKLDLVSLPSHTSHALQPLDVAVFKPFKTYFREYWNYWTSRNIGQKATKETLAHWVSLALRKALNENNITKGFKKTGIYPLDRTVVDKELGPSETFRSEHNTENSSLPEEGRHAEGVHSLSRSGPQQVWQHAPVTNSWDAEPAGEENNNEPTDSDDEAFDVPAFEEDEDDVLQGQQDLCNQDCDASYNEPVSAET